MAFNIVLPPQKADIDKEKSYIQEETIFLKHLLQYLAETESKQEFANACVHWYEYQKSLDKDVLYKAISLLFWTFYQLTTLVRLNKWGINSILPSMWWRDE